MGVLLRLGPGDGEALDRDGQEVPVGRLQGVAFLGAEGDNRHLQRPDAQFEYCLLSMDFRFHRPEAVVLRVIEGGPAGCADGDFAVEGLPGVLV